MKMMDSIGYRLVCKIRSLRETNETRAARLQQGYINYPG